MLGILARGNGRLSHRRGHRRRRGPLPRRDRRPDLRARNRTRTARRTARLWCSLGHHDARGRFRIDGVTGPDEYSALADNNVYTNLMAQRNLRAAADAVERHPDRASALGVDEEETAAWRDAARAVVVPFDAVLGVHS